MIPQSNYYQCSKSSWLKTAIYTLAFFLTCSTLSAQSDTTCTAKVGNYKGTSVCFLDNQTLLKANYQGNTVTPEGFEVVYLLGYANQAAVKPVIQQIGNEPLFPLPASPQGIYTVHELVYDPATLNLSSVVLNETTVTKLKESLDGTCSALDPDGAEVRFGECENPCLATAGRLVATSNPCVKGNEALLTTSIQSAPVIPAGYKRLYALVNRADGEILRFGNNASFNVGFAGSFSIHTLVYDTATLNLDGLYNEGIVTLTSIDTLLVQGGGDICGALDLVGATFEVENCPEPCQVSAGTLGVGNNPCLKDSTLVISARTNVSPVLPNGHQVRYLLSIGAEKLVQQIGITPSFTVSDTITYTIHTIVYDPNHFNPDSLSLDSLTVATIDSALATLCGDVDLTGAVFNVKTCPTFVCSANTGLLVADESTCLYNGNATLSATVGLGSLVPFGYKVIYLLSAGDSMVIEKLNTTPSFTVTEAGRFSIHTLVYDTADIKIDSIKVGETTIFDLNALLFQGGGAFCGALDTAGAIIQLEVCADCPAKTGRLTSNTVPCLENGVATLTAYDLESPVVPSGFKLAYLLSGGNGSVIEQVSDSASFVVNRIDAFTIHTLVYDFALLDLDSIQTGVTTISQLNSQLIQGGGNLCGALDTKGFSYFVLPCVIQCDAKAGSLESIGQTCLQEGAALIEAAFDSEPVVPAGFVVRYLLSVSNLNIISEIRTTPSFEVSAIGDYTIHTLVYDPATLNINDIQLNITSIEQVSDWLIDGGGDICGALDKKGLSYQVWACEAECGIDIGQLNIFNRFICIANGSATLSAFIQTQPAVPSGFKLKYLLTHGTDPVIQQSSDNPVFRVNMTGRFAIHTVVYNPNTLNLNSLIPGVTKLSDLNQQLLQGGGIVCAGLDMEGVYFQVSTCLGDDSDANLLRAYPNPSTQKLNLVLPQANNVTKTTVELVNSNGNIVQTWQIDGYNLTLYLDVSTVQPGVYYARVYYDGNFIQQTSVIRAQ